MVGEVEEVEVFKVIQSVHFFGGDFHNKAPQSVIPLAQSYPIVKNDQKVVSGWVEWVVGVD